MTSLKHLDLKSVPCPLNVVKIKLALEKLSKNQQLIVELDKGEPEEMVLNNLKEMGELLFKSLDIIEDCSVWLIDKHQENPEISAA